MPIAQANDYWTIQIELIKALAQCGVHLKATDRVDPFYVRILLMKKAEAIPDEQLGEALHYLDQLVIKRTQGFEPLHNGKRYL